MPGLTIGLILGSVLVTATISGVFGMAGGLIMKGVLVSLMPVAASMVLHGFIQLTSNLSRAVLLARHIAWRIVGRYALGAATGVGVLMVLGWRPGQTTVFFLLGLTALVVLAPQKVIAMDASRPWQSELSGFLVQLFNTLAGVAGPLLDVFFVKTEMTRQTVVATKAATQVLAHAVKIAFWGGAILATTGADVGESGLPPTWLFIAVVPLSLAGTWAGGKALDRMSDVGFRSWTKWIVAGTGVVYLVRGFAALLAPQIAGLAAH
ncbi:MAG: TSUP family transporter [Hyphomonadaceae bacterium]